MANTTWKIYWSEYASNTYLYGTEVIFHAKDDVEFKNNLMPPGTVIKSWFSKTNYQLMRIEPTLPLIDGEGKYRISSNITSEEPEGLLLRLVFYDRYDDEISSQVIRDASETFECPLRTFSYELQLINAGTSSFHFHSIKITEITDEE